MENSNMSEPELSFDDLSKEVKAICEDLRVLTTEAGPTRCIAKLTKTLDPRLGKKKEFPIFDAVQKIVNRMNEGDERVNLILIQDCGNIILLSGFTQKPSNEEIRNLPLTLASHADEITFLTKKDSPFLLPLFNAGPLIKYGIAHPEVRVFGFRGIDEEREFKEIGYGKLHKAIREGKEVFFLDYVQGEERIEGDLVIQNYDLTPDKYDLNTIFHSKALDDRVGVLAHIYTMRELSRYGIKAKAIFVGDEEGVDADIAWARLARPAFRKYCRSDGITILTDGFDGKNLREFKNRKGEHLQEALIAPYRSEGKGAGDPGLFSLLRDNIVPLSLKHGFEPITTTDYVSRSLDPKIMDDFPFICSIDWSNGPVMIPLNGFLPVCHVDESVSIKQIVNIIGTAFWAVWFFNKRIEKL